MSHSNAIWIMYIVSKHVGAKDQHIKLDFGIDRFKDRFRIEKVCLRNLES